MKKALLLTAFFAFVTILGFSQTDRFWSANNENRSTITTEKAVARLSFPKEFKLFNLNLESLRQELFTIVDRSAKRSTIISLPNTEGQLEQFQVYEASNFEPDLQARFPEIRAYSGKGITDKNATLKISISPQGIQTMVFRTEKSNEFIEPYSSNHAVYAVFKSQRNKGQLPWVCTTQDQEIAAGLNTQIANSNFTASSTGELRTMRLAQSCNGEYSNWFGAFNAGQVALVLAAYNNTLTRCNGCYEKDLAIHLNLIANTTAVIYYDPLTDPYTTMGNWNAQLQATLTAVIGEANYDIGHMFGASGGGGNAGCIGCVCVNGIKGSGITSPADGIPQGDNFDIDYVAHEVGHQMGGNHSFTFSNEGTTAQREVGAGITIMGYAGITSYDPAPHSIDIFHAANIAQIQANMATKTCPITTVITANNATPVVAPVANFTIPISTPFALTGSATDANPGDVLTYCWEQYDLHGGQTGANSVAYAAKPTGPNYLTFPAITSPTRLLPRLSTILAGLFITPTLPGGDAICNIEALSSVSRTLNFRLTVRDNAAYIPVTAPGTGSIGQTAFTDMVVTVTNTSGPFKVTSPNTPVSYVGGSSQTITWDVAGTTGAPVSCANVKITVSTDGGLTFPNVLTASTANDGSEVLTIPNIATTTARLKIEAVGNIFFDIDDANFTITSSSCTGQAITGQPVATSVCAGAAASFTVTATGNPAPTYQWQLSTAGVGGPWSNVPVGAPYSGNTTATLNINPTAIGMNGYAYRCVVSGCVPDVISNAVVLTVNGAPTFTAHPANTSACVASSALFSVTATGTGLTYQWQLSTAGVGGPFANIPVGAPYGGTTTPTLTINPTVIGMNGYAYRCVVTGCATSVNSNPAVLTIVAASVGGTVTPANTNITCATNTGVLTLAGHAGSVIRWEVSTAGAGGPWTTVLPNNTTTTLTYTNVIVNTWYRAVVQAAGCTAANSSVASITVLSGTPMIIVSDAGTVLCQGDPARLTATNGPALTTFTNAGVINIPAGQPGSSSGIAGPYPSNLTVSALPVSGVNVKSVTLTGLNHTWSGDLDIVLQSPSGQNVMLLSDIGGGADFINNTMIFDDAAAGPFTVPPAAGATATVRPTNLAGPDAFPAPGPASVPANPTLATFTGDFNGIWKLYINDQVGGDFGFITGGYSIVFSVPGGPITSGTFLWSPAAGLNSTTTNPVAASPAVTTTYTVAHNDGLGCTRTAQITLTVNTRPAVTVQPPASTVVCAGSAATITAGGSGTGVTYQWQVSTTGAGGPWVNLTNGAPYAGVNTVTLTINPATLAMNGYIYRLAVGGACPPTANSNGSVLTVNALPTVTVTPTTGCGGVAGTNGLMLTASGANTYTWAPTAGLYTNATATTAYVGGNANPVYAAPTSFTTYTVTGTATATGCSNTATAQLNYTPPAPTVTPASVTMCLGDPAVRLVSASAVPGSCTTASGVLSIPIPDNTANGISNNLTVSCVPAGAIITGVSVNFSVPAHTYVGDLILNLRAPNGTILNLDKYMSATATQAGTYPNSGFVNATISSAGTTALGSATSTPITGTWRADLINGAIPFAIQEIAGFTSTATNWNAVYGTPNGVWTLAIADGGPADIGTLTGWSITVNYLVGVPSTPATWSPIAGLFNDAAATIAYTGTPRDTVWTMPTPSGVYPYTVTVQSIPPPPASFSNPAAITINDAAPGSPYPSNITVSGLPTTGVAVSSVSLNGMNHTWASDIDVLLQSPTGQNVILMSDVGGNVALPANATYTFSDAGPAMAASANPGGTYRPTNLVGTLGAEPDPWAAPGPGAVTQPAPALSLFGSVANVNGVWKLFVVDDAGGDAGSIGGGWTINFSFSVPACTSPARTVVVTVNTQATVTVQPVAQTVCTDKVATFSVSATIPLGTIAYQWQVSTDGGNTYNNVTNGGVYSGATTNTLTITNPPVSMNGYIYRVRLQGPAPCAPAYSFFRMLTVNPLPTVVISASPYTRLFPGLITTLSSTVSPVAAATYTWYRDGIAVAGANGPTLSRDVDGQGDYYLRVTDVNGCTNNSNIISLRDSVSSNCFLYPNPNKGLFQVRYHSAANNVLARSVTVYNSNGTRVLTQYFTVVAPYARMDLDLRPYGKGAYWVEIGDHNGNRLTMCRAVVQ